MNSAQNMNKVMMMVYVPSIIFIYIYIHINMESHWGLLYPILLLYCVDPGDPRRPDRERRERREPRIAVR
jgi:hypothetical protein